MSDSKKTRPLSPQEIARRKEAAKKQAQLNNEPLPKSYASLAGKAGKFAAKKSQNFRHQGR
jgi:hypothetical protein